MSGVLNLGTVEFAVAAASRKKDIVYEAAAILEFIAKNHPFLDGNKRTAFASAATILRLGGFEVGRLMMTLSSSCWRWRRTGSLSPRLRLG